MALSTTHLRAVDTFPEGKIPQYLEKVVSLEKSIYAQNQTIQALQNRINNLGHARVRAPYQPEKSYDFDFKTFFGTLLMGAILGIFASIFFGSWKTCAFWGAVILGGGWIALECMVNSDTNSERRDRYNQEMREYQQDTNRVKNEIEEKKNLEDIMRSMVKQRNETVNILEHFYSVDVIFPKYRNLIAMCSIYEYFLSGRCDKLSGYEGAYNIFENEVRLDQICTKLDDVIHNLEQIRHNQFELYSAIQEGNKISQQLLNASIHQAKLLEKTAENTAITARNAEIAARNAEACAWIGLANYISIEDGKKRLNN